MEITVAFFAPFFACFTWEYESGRGDCTYFYVIDEFSLIGSQWLETCKAYSDIVGIPGLKFA